MKTNGNSSHNALKPKTSITCLVLIQLLTVAVAVVILWICCALFWIITANIILPPNDKFREPSEPLVRLDCEVLIIGSGFAGSFAAYQLAPQYGERLCLVERLGRDGGRIYDVSEYPGGPVFGLGALRITNHQITMVDLARNLGIVLEEANGDDVLKVNSSRHNLFAT